MQSVHRIRDGSMMQGKPLMSLLRLKTRLRARKTRLKARRKWPLKMAHIKCCIDRSNVKYFRWIAVRLWLNGLIFRRYMNRQILVNAIFCTPDRYLAIFCSGLAILGLIASLLGVDIAAIFNVTGAESNTPSSFIHQLITAVLLALYLLVVTLISVFVTRRAPEEFAQLLSIATSTDFVVKALAFEAWIITLRLKNEKDYKGVQSAIRRSRVNFELVRLLKSHVADRFHIPTRIFSDHFLQFSASILRNRMLKKASNLSFFDLSLKDNSYRLNQEEEVYLQQQTKAIEDYSAEVIRHLEAIIHSDINFSGLEDIYKNRSGTAALMSFALYLKNNQPKNRKDYELLYEIQKSYDNGFIWKRLITCCLDYLCFYGNESMDKKNRFEARLNYLLSIKKDEKVNPYLDRVTLELWSTEMNDYIREQRKPILNKVKSSIATLSAKSNKEMDFLNDAKPIGREDPTESKVYILLVDYSRTVRYVMKKLLDSEDLPDNIHYFFWLPDDENMAFGSRLLQHQLFKESNIDEKSKPKSSHSGSLDLFKSRIGDHDKVVVMMGCDGISNENEQSVYSRLNNRFQNELDVSRENKTVTTYFYALFPEYKNNLPSLIRRIKAHKAANGYFENYAFYESVEASLSCFVEDLVPCSSFGYLWKNIDVIRKETSV